MPELLTRVGYDQLPEWSEFAASSAMAAFQRSSAEILSSGHGFSRTSRFGGLREDWIDVCNQALCLSVDDAQTFFQSAFTPCEVSDPNRPEGLFTGYYQPEIRASRTRHGPYQYPIYRRPADHAAFTPEEAAQTNLSYGLRTDGKIGAYYTRRQIEEGCLAGQDLEICFADDPVDVFFLHVQGQGRATLDVGTSIQLSYAAKSGLPYKSIGAILVERGIFTHEQISMQSLRNWMAQDKTAARELMWENPSFVFFRESAVPAGNLGGIGAAKVHLEPMVSMAVDRANWAFGTPFWLDTTMPPNRDSQKHPLRRLLVAQDTGSAIKGVVRGDVFWGGGEDAAWNAGHMKSSGKLFALLPNRLAHRLGLAA